MLCAFFGFSQNAYITKDLQTQLLNTKGEEKIRINILMEERLDVLELKYDQLARKATIHDRAVETVSLLKNHAKSTQDDVINAVEIFESEFPGSYSNIQQFWAINMLVLDATTDLIYHLSLRDDIALMECNRVRVVEPILPVSSKVVTTKSPGGIEPGLAAINAPALWKMGYTGRGRKSFNLDTGAWTDHPAITERFLGNFYPISESFFSLDVDFPVDKSGSHGTHTLGTTLGLDRSTNDTIGVAFNAYYSVADLVATSDATVKPLTDFVFAFEWAMDPDGDPQTTDDIPDVINNSWGYLPADANDLCDSYMNDLFIALESCGIAVVFAAGNEGSDPQTIGLPQHLNSGVVNVFTVGSVNPNLEGIPISTFSSRGPTICPGEGSLKIKPEVVAPGEEVRSCVGHNGYSENQGTSMACPHVSGAVLLLKEAFPYLSGQDILLALYHSTTDLGEPGEDNNYGTGIIDVLAAYNYLAQDHEPVSPDSYQYDVAISKVNYPAGILACSQRITPKIEVTNLGTETITNLSVDYWFADKEVNNFEWEGNLAAGESVVVELDEIQAEQNGANELYVTLKLADEITEIDLVNNRRVLRFDIREEFILPFNDDFNTGSLEENGWYVINPDLKRTWDTITVDTNDYSFSALYMNSWSYGSGGQIDQLVSPGILFPENGDVKLSFKWAYQHIIPTFTDTLRLLVSSDCGLSTDYVLFDKGGEDLSTNGVEFSVFIPTDSTQWNEEEIDLSSLLGAGNVVFTFEVYSNKGNNLFIDDFSIAYEGEPYRMNEQNGLGFIIYPNPVNSYVMIENIAMNPEAVEISVLDLTGRSQLNKVVDCRKARIDVSQLLPGIYVLSIKQGERVEYHRIIKK